MPQQMRVRKIHPENLDGEVVTELLSIDEAKLECDRLNTDRADDTLYVLAAD